MKKVALGHEKVTLGSVNNVFDVVGQLGADCSVS